MFEHGKISALSDFFSDMNSRNGKKVYFYRITGFDSQVQTFLSRYYQEALRCGVIIDGGIPNPNENNLSYYNEIMGGSFELNPLFINRSLKKWLPRMNDEQRNTVADSVYDTLNELAKSGKNENILKNAYIKFMCWLYYKFESIVGKLGGNSVPKILYDGNITRYELLLVSVLSRAGCDVVLLERSGDAAYLKCDPQSLLSDLFTDAQQPFPSDFSVAEIRKNINRKQSMERVCGEEPSYTICHNSWTKMHGLSDVLIPLTVRKSTDTLNTIFYRIFGVEDRLSYVNTLVSMQNEIKQTGRSILILKKNIPVPSNEEIAAIKRKNYNNMQDAVIDLSANIIFAENIKLQKWIRYEFIRLMLDNANIFSNLNKLVNTAVYILCWLKRYQSQLFKGWKDGDISCFVMFGGCGTSNEAFFVKLISRLPADVLVLIPELNSKCLLSDDNLADIYFDTSLSITEFPEENSQLHLATSAFHAERDLDTILYQDSGLYRDYQYGKATSVVLKTMYEEIELMWNEELKYRPGFSADNGEVTVPVFFAKVSGVKNRDINSYWQLIKKLITKDTLLINANKRILTDNSPIRSDAVSFLKNGRLLKNKIKEHSAYQYSVLRNDIQEHILDKLQFMIDSKIIKGTFENGTEYSIISTVLSLDKEIVRKLQKFDFTKSNPKVVYINTGESKITPEEAIVTQFLSLIGFDVIFFVPTGYQNVETYFTKSIIEEHQVGEFVYDLQIPDFSKITVNTHKSWRERLFGRGV